MSFLTNIQLGSPTQPGIGFTVNRYVNAGANKLVLNGTGTNIFELTTGAGGLTRRFAFASSGQYIMDAYGSGTFTGTETKWLAVTAAGLVIEKDPPSASITADEGLTMFTASNVRLFGSLATPATLTTDRYLTASSNTLNITADSLAGVSAFKVSSTSTAAASNLQRGIEASLSGVNANANQTTAAIYGSNTHTGPGVTISYGVHGTTTSTAGGLSAGVAGINASTGWGVLGRCLTSGTAIEGAGPTSGIGVSGSASTSGIGVKGSTASGQGVFGSATTGTPLYGLSDPSSTNTATIMLTLNRRGLSAGADGIGGYIDFELYTTTTSSVLSNRITSSFPTATHASRISTLTFLGVTDTDSHNLIVFSGPQSTLLSRDAGTNQTDERYSVVGTYKTLTESSATAFIRVNIPSSTVTGGEILITVEANDGTDFQSRTLRFIWSAVNKSGTITATVQTPEEAVAVSAGTLTVTIDTNDAGSGNLDFRANAVSSLTQTVLRCSYQVFKNIGTGAITPQ